MAIVLLAPPTILAARADPATAPTAVLAMPDPIGDCPQFSMLAAAMFRVACMNSLFVTIAAERSFPEQWSHIYNTVEVSPGRFLPFDSSHGPEPGAEYARPFKRRVWPRLTPGLCTPGTRQKGKAMVRSSYAANAGRGMRSHTLRGNLGDCSEDDMGNTFCTDSTITYDTTPGSGVLTPGVLDPTDCLYGVSPSTGGCNGAPGTPVMTSTPPGSGAPGGLTNAQLAAILGNSAVNAAAPAIKLATQQTPYYVTNPVTGQSVLYNPNTGTLSGASTALSSALSPSVLLMLGLGIAAIALIGKK